MGFVYDMSQNQATPAITQTGEPVLILKEGSSETKGNDAQKNNTLAAKLIAEVVKTSLGPRGMDKMLVDNLGDVTITNDGATILKQMDVQHPAAKIIIEISKTTDNEVGDGTTSAVVLAGALLERAERLIDKGLHPTIIVEGYSKAAEKALETLNEIAVQVKPEDKGALTQVAETSMRSKLVSSDSARLASIVVEAISMVADKSGNDDATYKVDNDNVKVEKKSGASIADTKLIKGIVLDKEVVSAAMPKRVVNARIALVNSALEIEKTEYSAEIRINDPSQMKKFLQEENSILSTMIDKIRATGTNVVVCQKGIDDVAQSYLAQKQILAVRRTKESDMAKLSRATGARIITNLDDISENDLGYAGLVEERKVEQDKWVFVEDCRNAKAVTILVRGESQRIVDEAERGVHDAIMVVKDLLEKPAIVAGGGAVEAELATSLREYSNKLSGRKQLAVEAFADALEFIPQTLAENAGMDQIETQAEIRAKHSQGKKWYGINVYAGKVSDMMNNHVIEPVAVKEQIIESAAEAASMILRVDDVIASGKTKQSPSSHGASSGMDGSGD